MNDFYKQNFGENFLMIFLILIFLLIGFSLMGFSSKHNKIVVLEKQSNQNISNIYNSSIDITQNSKEKICIQNKPKYVRGIHLTAWAVSSLQKRKEIDYLLEKTELNTVVIDIKESEGKVYIPGVKVAEEIKSYENAIPDILDYLNYLKEKKVYTIARIVVFSDNFLPRQKPELGVKTPEGQLWKDKKGITWLDPYRKENWEYILSIAERAVQIGFEEVQFDYIRFPSDGDISLCIYSQPYNSKTAQEALIGFLKEANTRIKPLGANISIDIFGLTTSVLDDMGIGQKLEEMAKFVDYVSPMTYPSHYAKGTYGLSDPNRAPYQTVYCSLKYGKEKLGSDYIKLRPFLQDFSLGYRYGAKEVRAQIQAAYDNDIYEWLLWNPRCIYTYSALKDKSFSNTYEKSKNITCEIKKQPLLEEKISFDTSENILETFLEQK